MPRRNHQCRKAATLFLCLLTPVSVVRLYGQDKPQVAPPAKSDSYATNEHGGKIRIQHREVAGANFQIAGVDLTARGDFFTRVFGVLGKVTTVWSGDGADSNHEACYRPVEENDRTHLIFGEGEVDESFTLSSDGSSWKWKTPCKRSSRITRSLASASGLRLGQTQEQVIAILGLPTSRSRNLQNGRDELVYELESKRDMSSRELAPILEDELKRHPNLDQRAFIKNYGFYSIEVSIHAKFVNVALTNLTVSWSEQY